MENIIIIFHEFLRDKLISQRYLNYIFSLDNSHPHYEDELKSIAYKALIISVENNITNNLILLNDYWKNIDEILGYDSLSIDSLSNTPDNIKIENIFWTTLILNGTPGTYKLLKRMYGLSKKMLIAMNDYDEIDNNVLYFIFNIVQDNIFMDLVNLFDISRNEVKYLLLLAIKNKNVRFVIKFREYGFKLDLYSKMEIHELLYYSTPEILLVLKDKYGLTKNHFKRIEDKIILDFHSINDNNPSILRILKESFGITKEDLDILEIVKTVENNNDLVLKELRNVFLYEAKDIKNIERSLVEIAVKINSTKIIRDLVINFNIDKNLVKNIIQKNIDEKEDLLRSVTLWGTNKIKLPKLIIENLDDTYEDLTPSPGTPLIESRSKKYLIDLEKIPRYDSNDLREYSFNLDTSNKDKLSITSFSSENTIVIDINDTNNIKN